MNTWSPVSVAGRRFQGRTVRPEARLWIDCSSVHASVSVMSKFDKSWDNGHRFGWFVYKDNRILAELEYVSMDYPCHLFRVKPLTTNLEEIQLLIGLRAADPKVFYRNRMLDMVVSDSEFCLNAYDAELIAIRDFRAPPMVPTLLERVRSFLFERARSFMERIGLSKVRQ
jgi:hypothetical protein